MKRKQKEEELKKKQKEDDIKKQQEESKLQKRKTEESHSNTSNACTQVKSKNSEERIELNSQGTNDQNSVQEQGCKNNFKSVTTPISTSDQSIEKQNNSVSNCYINGNLQSSTGKLY